MNMLMTMAVGGIVGVLVGGAFTHYDFENKAVELYAKDNMHITIVDRGIVDLNTTYFVIDYRGVEAQVNVNHGLLETRVKVVE